MIVHGLFAVLTAATLLSGCIVSDIERLRSDARTLKSYISKSHYGPEGCVAPGNPQDKICNYRLVVKNIGDDYYQGYVDPKLVAEGVRECQRIFESKEYKESKDPDVQVQDYKCARAEDYTYWLYEFRIVGLDQNEKLDGVVDLVNEPRSDRMRKGHIESAEKDVGKIKHGKPQN